MAYNKCQYGFSTCSFIGQVDFCNTCGEGQNYQMKQETRGGSRKGSGRPKSEPTKILTFRVKVKDAEKLRAKIKALLKK